MLKDDESMFYESISFCVHKIGKCFRKEVGELKALLELKRRTRGSGGAGSGVRLGMPLEEAAEFEYLKNVLYQYMLGKETQVSII